MDRIDRAHMLLNGWDDVVAGLMEFESLRERFLQLGGGDPNDRYATYVDMLADIGHWMGGGGSRLQDVAGPGPLAARDPETAWAAEAVGGVRDRLASEGFDPVQAVCSAAMHVDAEVAEEGDWSAPFEAWLGGRE